jgi:predicted phage terminase large subunit-like protein
VNVLDSVWLEQSKKDKIIKEIILTADFETAYYTVCKYITCRSLQPLHASIIHNVSDNQASMDLAPRGHGKSTIGDVDFCITKVLRNPDIRIMIGSKTQTQASAFLKEIRTHFEQNVNLIRIFGDWKKSRDNVWNDKEFTVNRRTMIKKEATVSALGASGAVVSKHFDIIIGDDLVGFENARTEAQRKVLKEWFYSSLYPTLEPDGEIHILGTRYSPMDLYEDLIKSKNYKVNVQQAITVKDGQEYSLWESKFSLEKLRSIREEAGLIIFNMQYQNNTELAKGKIFKYKYFKHFEEYDIDYDLNRVRVKVLDSQGVPYWIPVRIYMGADLAISEDETSNNDYFVLTVIGVDKNKNVYVLDYLKERLTFNAQLNAILDYGKNKFPMVERIGVETVQYQKSLAQEIRRLSLLPVINIQTSKDKVTRAMRRSALFENGKVWFRIGMDDLEECLLLFPEVDHDDLFDGLDFALTVADQGNSVRVLNREDFNI